MMLRTVILSFEIPAWAVQLARRFGVKVITRQGIRGDEHARYVAAGAGSWIAAHEVLKRALDAAQAASDGAKPLAATTVSGIPAGRAAHRFTQQLNISYGFDVLFLASVRATFGGSVVLPAPAAFRHQLAQAGLPIHPLLSSVAWNVRRLQLLAQGLVAHILHAWHAVQDEMRPARLPEWARNEAVAVWPATYAGGFSADPSRMSVGNFFRTGAVAPFRESGVLVVADAEGSIEPPLVNVRHVLSARRGPGGNRAAVMRVLAEQLRLMGALLAGGWRESIFARETALLPRARLYVDEVRPVWVVGALPNIASPNLWCELARQSGAKLYIICNSAQTTAIHRRDEMRPGHVPHIYMHPVADGFGAWTPTHAQALARFGIPAGSIEVGGPMIYSARPPRRHEPLAGRLLRVDYFDQVPYQTLPIGESGVPGMYWTVERLTRTAHDVLAAMEKALPPNSFRMRIKSKKVVRGLDAGYFGALAALAEASPAVELLDWRTSALALNADSDLTISFPFASPSISAHWYGVPACFYDVDGEAAQDPLILDGLPVLTGIDALVEWIRGEYTSLLRQQEAR